MVASSASSFCHPVCLPARGDNKALSSPAPSSTGGGSTTRGSYTCHSTSCQKSPTVYHRPGAGSPRSCTGFLSVAEVSHMNKPTCVAPTERTQNKQAKPSHKQGSPWYMQPQSTRSSRLGACCCCRCRFHDLMHTGCRFSCHSACLELRWWPSPRQSRGDGGTYVTCELICNAR
jgi:hypothetical protein